MKILLSSINVQDQDKALQFYTEVLGFTKKNDIPMGPFRWLTVISPEGHDDVELVLEPNENPASQEFMRSLFAQGIPRTAFAVDDIQAEFERLTKMGVVFKAPPMNMGPVTVAMFDDTCGNWIQLYQVM